jgi:hypothetical protein
VPPGRCRQPGTSDAGRLTRHFMSTTANARCARKHRHGGETPGPRLQMVMLGRQHGRNDIDAAVTVAAPPRGIMGPSSGSLCGYSAPQPGFAGHVLNDKDRAEHPTQAPAILRAPQVGTVASAAPLRAVRQIGALEEPPC